MAIIRFYKSLLDVPKNQWPTMIVQFEEIEGSMDDQKNMDESVKDTKKGLFNKVCFHQCRINCSVRPESGFSIRNF